MTGRHGAAPYSPYVGLRPFGPQDADRFFGRTREIREIAALWCSNKLTVVYGPSGVGKTSLLHAGVIPALDPERFEVWPVGRVSLPVGTDREPDSGAYTAALLSSWHPERPPDSFAGLSLTDFLERYGERTDRYGDPIPTLVAIDQAEELFLPADLHHEAREEFLRELGEAVHRHRGLRLLLSLRQEHLADVLPYERLLGQGSRARFAVHPLSREAALQAVRRPLERVNWSFLPGAAERLVDTLTTAQISDARGIRRTVRLESVEPVQLQVVCTALWESLPWESPPPESRVVTVEHVETRVDVDRSLTNFCSRAITETARRHGISPAPLRAWLRRTFVTEHGTRGTAYEGLTHTAGMPNAVVRDLEDHHILRAEYRSGSRWYELQHDRLIGPLQQADPAEHLQTARQAYRNGQWDIARDHAEQALRFATGNDLALLGMAERTLGDIDTAQGAAESGWTHYHTAAKLLEAAEHPTEAIGRLLADCGRLSVRLGKYSRAVDEFTAALARAPGEPAIQRELAQALWHSGEPRAALAVLDGVLSLTREPDDALLLRGEILADLGQGEPALRDLDRVDRPLPPAAQAARALALAVTRHLAEAEREAAAALTEAADHGPVLLRAARVRALCDDHPAAAELAARALAATDPALPSHLREEARRLLSASG